MIAARGDASGLHDDVVATLEAVKPGGSAVDISRRALAASGSVRSGGHA